jgi:hypothetical protein
MPLRVRGPASAARQGVQLGPPGPAQIACLWKTFAALRRYSGARLVISNRNEAWLERLPPAARERVEKMRYERLRMQGYVF